MGDEKNEETTFKITLPPYRPTDPVEMRGRRKKRDENVSTKETKSKSDPISIPSLSAASTTANHFQLMKCLLLFYPHNLAVALVMDYNHSL